MAGLRAAGLTEVEDGTRRRAEYSSDASNHRVVPTAVAYPRDADEVLAALAVCRELGTPLTMRGGGTSIAGNAIGPGLVLDTSRHLTRLLALDPDARTAVVRARGGAGPDHRRRRAARAGLRSRPLHPLPGHHRRHDRQQRLRGARDERRPGRGHRGRPGRRDGGGGAVHRRPRQRRAGRPVAGRGRRPGGDPHRVRSVPPPGVGLLAGAPAARAGPARGPVPGRLGGHPGRAAAGHRVPRRGPGGHRAGGARLPGHARRRRRRPRAAAARAPRRGGDGRPAGRRRPAPAGARRRAGPAARGRLAVRGGGGGVRRRGAGRRPAAGRRRRRAGLPRGRRRPMRCGCGGSGRTAPGLGGRTPAGAPAWPGWEDAAVPPEHLGAYLRDFRALLDAHGLDALVYGHLGDGCVHARIDFPLADRPQVLREFVEAAADVVAGYGGSVSGEHGDGRARSELLPRMYGPELLAAFAAVKHAFDPTGLLNPGVLVDPEPLDATLRLPAAHPAARPAGSRWPHGRRRPVGGRAPLRRGGPVPGRRHGVRGGHVPVVPGHRGREGLHPRPGPGAAGGGQRHAGRRAGRPGGAGVPGPVPVLQGLRRRLPGRGGHGDLQGRGAARPVPPVVAAADALVAGLAAG